MANGYLHADDVLFYHPCESDRVESTKGLAWTNAGGSFEAAVLGSGFTRTSAGEGSLWYPTGTYGSLSGNAGWTCAFWLKNPEADNQWVYVGAFDQIGSAFDPRNAMGLFFYDSPSNKFLGKLSTRGGTVSFSDTPANPLSGSGFVVLHVEFGASVASGWISLNGSGWQSLGTASRQPPDNDGSGLAIVRRDAPANYAIIDEMILWRNTEQFTSGELGNLYELAHTHGLGMDQYDAQFGEQSGSGSPGWQVTELLRTHDHHPQVIGLLDYVGTSGDVDVTVYELTNMTEVSLGHSGCYPIGDTGRWGWSTAYLPGDTRHGQHFVYRMATSGAAQTFAGEFFLRFPESDRR